jgi:hypothetical protein
MSMMNAADSQTTSVGIIEIMVTHALVHGIEHPACVSVARVRYGSCPEPISGTKIRYPPLLIFGQRPARAARQSTWPEKTRMAGMKPAMAFWGFLRTVRYLG